MLISFFPAVASRHGSTSSIESKKSSKSTRPTKTPSIDKLSLYLERVASESSRQSTCDKGEDKFTSFIQDFIWRLLRTAFKHDERFRQAFKDPTRNTPCKGGKGRPQSSLSRRTESLELSSNDDGTSVNFTLERSVI